MESPPNPYLPLLSEEIQSVFALIWKDYGARMSENALARSALRAIYVYGWFEYVAKTLQNETGIPELTEPEMRGFAALIKWFNDPEVRECKEYSAPHAENVCRTLHWYRRVSTAAAFYPDGSRYCNALVAAQNKMASEPFPVDTLVDFVSAFRGDAESVMRGEGETFQRAETERAFRGWRIAFKRLINVPAMDPSVAAVEIMTEQHLVSFVPTDFAERLHPEFAKKYGRDEEAVSAAAAMLLRLADVPQFKGRNVADEEVFNRIDLMLQVCRNVPSQMRVFLDSEKFDYVNRPVL